MEPDSLASPSPAPVPISPNDEVKEEVPLPPMPPNDEASDEAASTNKRIRWWTVAIPCTALIVFGICFFVINNFGSLYSRFAKLSKPK